MTILLRLAGSVAVLLGLLGVFLPLLPTTPFLLLACACFARSSPRLHARLLASPLLGPYIRDFTSGKGVPLRTKLVACTLMWASLAYAMTRVPHWAGVVTLLAIGLGVTVYIARLPGRSVA